MNHNMMRGDQYVIYEQECGSIEWEHVTLGCDQSEYMYSVLVHRKYSVQYVRCARQGVVVVVVQSVGG